MHNRVYSRVFFYRKSVDEPKTYGMELKISRHWPMSLPRQWKTESGITYNSIPEYLHLSHIVLFHLLCHVMCSSPSTVLKLLEIQSHIVVS